MTLSGRKGCDAFVPEDATDTYTDLVDMYLYDEPNCHSYFNSLETCNAAVDGYLIASYDKTGSNFETCCPACNFDLDDLDDDCFKITTGLYTSCFDAAGQTGILVIVNDATTQGSDDLAYCCAKTNTP